VCWSYCGHNSYYWENYWYPKKWGTYFVEYHNQYDYVNTYPNIYSPPAMVLDPNTQIIDYLDQGAEFFRIGEYLEALHMFRLATLVDLNFAVPKFAYAQALFALGIYDYAAYEIRLGLELLPEWVEIGGDITLMYGDIANFEEQLSILKTHLMLYPDDEDAILVFGYVSFFSGDLYIAQKAFEALSTSNLKTNQETAVLFRSMIDNIKGLILAQDPQSAILKDDKITLRELILK